MKVALSVSTLVLMFASMACSSSSSTGTPTTNETDASTTTNDSGSLLDSSASTPDAGATDSSTQISSDAGFSLADASVTLGCELPSDCSGSTTNCCGTLVLSSSCSSVVSFTSQCTAACSTNLALPCGSETLHICATDTDCSGESDGNTQCCTLSQAMGHKFCFNQTEISLFGGSCN